MGFSENYLIAKLIHKWTRKCVGNMRVDYDQFDK